MQGLPIATAGQVRHLPTVVLANDQRQTTNDGY